MVRPGWVVVTLRGCHALLVLGIASRESRYNFLLCFWLCCHVFCPFVGVVCVTHLLSAVTGLIAHPLSLSFEGEDGVVMGFPHVWAAGLSWR